MIGLASGAFSPCVLAWTILGVESIAVTALTALGYFKFLCVKTGIDGCVLVFGVLISMISIQRTLEVASWAFCASVAAILLPAVIMMLCADWGSCTTLARERAKELAPKFSNAAQSTC